MRETEDFRQHFGGSDAEFFGMLVVGRRQFLPATGAHRMRRRSRYVPAGASRFYAASPMPAT